MRQWRKDPNWARPVEPRPKYSTKCSVGLCNRSSLHHLGGRKGLCQEHYTRKHKGEVNWDRPIREQLVGTFTICLFPGCTKPHDAKGYCKSHAYKVYPEIYRLKTQRYLSRKANASGEITKEEWLNTLDAYDYCCFYCGEEGTKLCMEHMTPLSRGGDNSVENIVPACRACNTSKGNRTLEEWAPELASLLVQE